MLLALQLLLLLLELCPGSHGQVAATAANGFVPCSVLAAGHAHAFCSLSQSSASLVPAEARERQQQEKVVTEVMADAEGRSGTTPCYTTAHTAVMAGALCCCDRWNAADSPYTGWALCCVVGCEPVTIDTASRCCAICAAPGLPGAAQPHTLHTHVHAVS